MFDHGTTLLGVAAVGLGIGLLGGLFGKGGSAVATPLLAAIGIPPIIAVASPLPATIPSTVAASWAYSRERYVDWRVVRWTVAFGVPATVIGALATRWVDGGSLVRLTDLVLVGLGIRLLTSRRGRQSEAPVATAPASTAELVAVATVVGLVSGLLANSGGFLLAPLFITVLGRPVKVAFASSLAVAAVLALPGTLVHLALGHIDWTIVAVFAATSVPLSFLGARIAIKADAARLERFYGGGLAVLGAALVFVR